ncbi:CD3337/EF1877 family mobilome membrane protein [Paenibacillus enshidis]|uniref:CD3337/EF1877 family mobilome membrane protein n=1 Tax=Paenibacillus enshidis TaxID=1458439 RepID=A0ABV5AVE7_9BACL
MIRRHRLLQSRSAFIVICFILLLSLFVPAAASASSIGKMLPSDGSSSNYNDYPLDHYSVETHSPERGMFEIVDKAKDATNSFWDVVISILFLIHVFIAKTFTFIAQEAFAFSYFNLLIDTVSNVIKNVTGISFGNWGTGLWGSFLPIFIEVMIIYICYLLLRSRLLDVFSQIVSFTVVLVLIMAFFVFLGDTLKYINNAVGDINQAAYSTVTTGSYSGNSKSSMTQLSTEVWKQVVIRPYSMLQFDTDQVDASTLSSVLSHAPGTDERDAALEAAAQKYPGVQTGRVPGKFLLLFVNAFLSGFILALYIYLSVMTIWTRMLSIVRSAKTTITLFLALLPGKGVGMSVIQQQIGGVLIAAGSTLLYMLFLSFALVLGQGLYTAVFNVTHNWFAAMGFQVLLLCALLWEVRKRNGNFRNPFSKKDYSSSEKSKKPSIVSRTYKRRSGNDLYNRTLGKPSLLGHANMKTNGVPKRFNPSVLQDGGRNINDAVANSMMLRYQREKDAAEKLSLETGAPLVYSPFVEQVHNNLQNGVKNPFRGLDKDWNKESERLSAVKKAGGNLKDAVLTQGLQPHMNDEQAAETMFRNEASINQARTFMSERPKEAMLQIRNAKKFVRNEQMEQSVDRFAFDQLYSRYNKERKDSVNVAKKTGEPIKDTPFVEKMNERFQHAGLHTAAEIKAAMNDKSKRADLMIHFNGMEEFQQTKDKLYSANEKYRKATGEDQSSASSAAATTQRDVKESSPFKVNQPAEPSRVASIKKLISAGTTAATSNDRATQISSLAKMVGASATLYSQGKEDTSRAGSLIRIISNVDTVLDTKQTKAARAEGFRNLISLDDLKNLKVSKTVHVEPKAELKVDQVKFSNSELKTKIDKAYAVLKDVMAQDQSSSETLNVGSEQKLVVRRNISTDITESLNQQHTHKVISDTAKIAPMTQSNRDMVQSLIQTAILARKNQNPPEDQ